MAKFSDLNDMTMYDWLAGCVGIDITEDAVNVILYDRDIEPDATLEETTKKQRELCKADLFMWCSTLPSTTGSVKDADGGWSHQEGGQRLTAEDKEAFRKAAVAIYRKYGEPIPGGTRIQINSHGMKMWRG